MRVYEKARKTVGQEWEITKVVCRNLADFIVASCLLAVSAYSGNAAYQRRTEFWFKMLLFASLTIGSIAAGLFLKHFKGGTNAPNFHPSVPVPK